MRSGVLPRERTPWLLSNALDLSLIFDGMNESEPVDIH